MTPTEITAALARNGDVFRGLLDAVPAEHYRWRPAAGKWSLLEIACHLRDEEVEDFRSRTQRVLRDPDEPLPSIDPETWVVDRGYADQDYGDAVNEFLRERAKSVAWLESLREPRWANTHQHPSFGPLTAGSFLANWLAHDLLHIRQIVATKFAYLDAHGGQDLHYAGTW